MQKFYTEQRIIRVHGEGADQQQEIMINQVQNLPDGGTRILNDITLGKYAIKIHERPLSASFKEAQMEEAFTILEKLGPVGMALAQLRPDLLLGLTSLPDRDEWIETVKQASQMQSDVPRLDQAGGVQAGGPQPANAPSIVQGNRQQGVA